MVNAKAIINKLAGSKSNTKSDLLAKYATKKKKKTSIVVCFSGHELCRVFLFAWFFKLMFFNRKNILCLEQVQYAHAFVQASARMNH